LSTKEIDTGVVLPEDGIVNVDWARVQLERTDAFSKELMYYGKGSVFFLLQTDLSQEGFEQAVRELNYTVETALVYINYLQMRPILTAIKAKYYVALSLSATEFIPDNIEEALALCDVCVANYGKFTKENLKKAAEATGTIPKKLSEAAINIESVKKKALYTWLLENYNLTEEDIHNAQKPRNEGKNEFTEKMIQAFFNLGEWHKFYKLIAETVHNNGSKKELKFLADLNDAAKSMEEFIKAEKAHKHLNDLKTKFDNEVYPELNYELEN